MGEGIWKMGLPNFDNLVLPRAHLCHDLDCRSAVFWKAKVGLQKIQRLRITVLAEEYFTCGSDLFYVCSAAPLLFMHICGYAHLEQIFCGCQASVRITSSMSLKLVTDFKDRTTSFTYG